MGESAPNTTQERWVLPGIVLGIGTIVSALVGLVAAAGSGQAMLTWIVPGAATPGAWPFVVGALVAGVPLWFLVRGSMRGGGWKSVLLGLGTLMVVSGGMGFLSYMAQLGQSADPDAGFGLGASAMFLVLTAIPLLVMAAIVSHKQGVGTAVDRDHSAAVHV